MKKLTAKLLLILFTVATFSFAACSTGHDEPTKPGNEQPTKPDVPDTPEEPDTPDQPDEAKQLRAEIAQMIVTSFPGAELFPNSKVYRNIVEYGIGGVILFEWQNNIASPSQLQKLCGDLQAAGKGNLLIAIDQEGGRVNRLKTKYGFPDFPSAKFLGEADDNTTKYWADMCASTLYLAGINMNFAPVVDVNVNPNSPGIGAIDRSFSADPNEVSKKAQIWIDAHHANSVFTCLKHFPGHGSATVDSHNGTTDITNTWTEQELIPYKDIIGADKADMIMIGHLFNSKFDPQHPASLSKKTIEGLLREQLHYDGVVITDDLAMGALVNNYGFEQILELTINAGVDMLCVSVAPSDFKGDDFVTGIIDIIEQKVKAGKISADRIHQANERIHRLKSRLQR